MQDASNTSMPLRGSALARGALRLFGWRVVGPATLPARAVVIAYPHTSNWDFLVGILGRDALGLSAHWVGKDSLFRWPLGIAMRALGGIAVNRRQRSGFVERIASEFAQREGFLLAIAPEGTRSRTPGWKSGFYRIALAAKVPVVLGCIDYTRHEVGIVGCVELSGIEADDLARIAAAYAGKDGRYPDRQSPVVLLSGR